MRFSPTAAIQSSWTMFMQRPALFLTAALVISVGYELPSRVIEHIDYVTDFPLYPFAWWRRVLYEATGILIYMGVVLFCLHVCGGLDAGRLRALFRPRLYWSFAIVWIVWWLAELSGISVVAALFSAWETEYNYTMDLLPWLIVFHFIGWSPLSSATYLFPVIVFDTIDWTPAEIMNATDWGFVWFAAMLVPYIATRVFLAFPGFLVIDQNLGPIKALKASIRMTKGNRGSLLCMVVFWAFVSFVAGMLVFYWGELALEGTVVVFASQTLKWIFLDLVFLLSKLSFAHAYLTLLGDAPQASSDTLKAPA
ncbi:MAG: hypothetical protein AAGF48_01705 [Pseudomonadota bacterium]